MWLFPLLLACTDPAPVDTAPTLWTPPAADETGRYVEFVTSMGTIQLELYLEEAPVTTGNLLVYVDEGFYDGSDGLGATVFHRIEPNFVIQGGGHLADGSKKGTHPPIRNEASNGLSNLRGTVAMARTSDPDSATSQWFVNLRDNVGLNPGESTPDGYAVFGEVVVGMAVIDAMAEVPVDGSEPLTPIPITLARRLDPGSVGTPTTTSSTTTATGTPSQP